MNKDLESLTLFEYRMNALSVLRDYKPFIPSSLFNSLYVKVERATTETQISRALATARQAL